MGPRQLFNNVPTDVAQATAARDCDIEHNHHSDDDRGDAPKVVEMTPET